MSNAVTLLMKKVIIGSKNPVKTASVKSAFTQLFPDEQFEFIGCDVASGVPDQPFGSAETRLGAHNRAQACSDQYPDAAYCVGLEGGLEDHDDELWATAWMCVRGSNGVCGFGKTSAFLLPPAVCAQIREGKELGDAVDLVFNRVNLKHNEGTVGVLTNGAITRADFYKDAIIFALIPFIQTSLYEQ